MKTILHVNQHVIKANRKHGRDDPPLTVKDYNRNRKPYGAFIKGPSSLLYLPEEPLKCGATIWIETEAEVECFYERISREEMIERCMICDT